MITIFLRRVRRVRRDDILRVHDGCVAGRFLLLGIALALDLGLRSRCFRRSRCNSISFSLALLKVRQDALREDLTGCFYSDDIPGGFLRLERSSLFRKSCSCSCRCLDFDTRRRALSDRDRCRASSCISDGFGLRNRTKTEELVLTSHTR